MPAYAFSVRDGSLATLTDEGIDLPDRTQTRDYALKVIAELMFRRERRTRGWCLDVYEDGNGIIFTIPFASVDRSLDHLHPELRVTVERRYEVWRQLTETIHAVGATVREARALMARSRGKPYLAAHAGEAIIRPELARAPRKSRAN